MINCATEVSSSGLFGGGVQYYSEDIKHRINNLSHSSEWNMRDISLSGYIFTRLRLVKIWPPLLVKYLAIFHSDSCNKYYLYIYYEKNGVRCLCCLPEVVLPVRSK